MISYSEALSSITNSIQRTMPMETVPLVLARGRILAQPIVAGENVPASANSAMDGYAIHAEDVSQASVESPATLRVIGEAAAGSVFDGMVGRGDAVRIMTGGLVPEGATAVVEVEATSEADGLVQVRRAVRSGESIRNAGEDVRAGAEVIAAGKRITPGDVGLLATLGITNVPVRVRPTVGILSTGNEIVEAFRVPGPGQVRNSSSPALYAACSDAGVEPIDLGIARDDRDELYDNLEQGLRFDVLLTTGGVSAGAYDYVQHLLPELGVEIQFHKTNIRPGKPLLFGTYGEGQDQTLVFGLPGNPVSSLVTFQIYVIPALRKLSGEVGQPTRIHARLTEEIRKHDSKRHFIRGILSNDAAGDLVVRKTGTQSSGAMSSMSLANCLIIIGEEVERVDAGKMVEVEML
jgi:molybdopterin molybdotransferase